MDRADVDAAEAHFRGLGVFVTVIAPGHLQNEPIQTVLSVPIRRHAAEILGVLNFDDEHKWHDSPLRKAQFHFAAERLAGSFADSLSAIGDD